MNNKTCTKHAYLIYKVKAFTFMSKVTIVNKMLRKEKQI